MSDPALSDIDFKNEIARVWTTLKNSKKVFDHLLSGWYKDQNSTAVHDFSSRSGLGMQISRSIGMTIMFRKA